MGYGAGMWRWLRRPENGLAAVVMLGGGGILATVIVGSTPHPYLLLVALCAIGIGFAVLLATAADEMIQVWHKAKETRWMKKGRDLLTEVRTVRESEIPSFLTLGGYDNVDAQLQYRIGKWKREALGLRKRRRDVLTAPVTLRAGLSQRQELAGIIEELLRRLESNGEEKAPPH